MLLTHLFLPPLQFVLSITSLLTLYCYLKNKNQIHISTMNQTQIFPTPNFFLFPSKSLPLLLHHLLSSLSTFPPPPSITYFSIHHLSLHTSHQEYICQSYKKSLCLFIQWKFLSLYFL